MDLKQRFTSRQCLRGFIILGTILIGIFLIGYVFNRDLFYVILQGDRRDTFMDFFNSVSHAIGRNPYGIKAIYPPLCYVIYWILGMAMGNEAMEILEHNETRQLTLKGLSQPMMVYWIYFVVSLTIFIYLAYRLIKGQKYERVCFLILVTMSVPFMFQFERANIIFLSLLGTMAFFVWKDSENRYLREIALICLAFSAAIKIYPAILGLVLIKEKKYKESARLMIYGILLFFLPFLFIRGGFSNIPLFIKNLIYTSTVDSAQRDGFKLSFSALSSYVIQKLTNNTILAEQLGSKIAFGITALGVCAFPWLRKSWKYILLLTCILVGFPTMSYTYTSIFFIVPLILFLNDKNNEKGKWIYFLLFLLIFFPLPFGWNEHSGIALYYVFNRSFNTLQISAAVLIFTILLIKEGLCNFILINAKHIIIKRISVVTGILVFAAILTFGAKLGYSKDLKNQKLEKQIVDKTLQSESITFNGNTYEGTYKGKTTNNKPSGKGVFTFPKTSSGIKLEGTWEGDVVNGNVRITYPDGTYELAACENGQVYGEIDTYNKDGDLKDRDWYYNAQRLSDIQKGAAEEDFLDMEYTNTLYPGTIFKCQGTVTHMNQTATWIEVDVVNDMGQKYLFSYYNGVFSAENSIRTPNLKIGDKVTCYGTLKGKDKKNVLAMDLISAELMNEQGQSTKAPDYTYEDIMRYPYKYVGKSIKLRGSVKKVISDFENNNLVYVIEEKNKEYALVIGLGNLFPKEYNLPEDQKSKITEKLEKTLPTTGGEINMTGTYKGNYILEEANQDSYKLLPYVYVSAQQDGKSAYSFESK